MAKFLSVWTHSKNSYSKKKIDQVAKAINPANIESKPTKILDCINGFTAVFNPLDDLAIAQSGLYMGNILEGNSWPVVGSEAPDGAFSMLRWDQNIVEILTDYVGSRTIWYYLDDNELIISNSQRAITMWLGRFELNENAISWLIYGGVLGPGVSWDRNLKMVPSNTTLTFDLERWQLHSKKNFVNNLKLPKSSRDRQKMLDQAIDNVFKMLDLNKKKVVLPLSGGYDSRLILLKLVQAGIKILSITWGSEESKETKFSDTWVAKKLSAEVGGDWKFFKSDIDSNDFRRTVQFFVEQSEARTEDIGGYLDRFEIWKILFEEGYQYIIRGDEPFGIAANVFTHFDARKYSRLIFPWDYDNLYFLEKELANNREIGLEYLRRTKESLESYRDRLYRNFRIPSGNAALSETKASYLEVINPFLSKDIVMIIERLTDAERNKKIIWKKIVSNLSPKIPFSSVDSVLTFGQILRNPITIKEIKKGLTKVSSKEIFGEGLVKEITSRMKTDKNSNNSFTTLNRIKSTLKKYKWILRIKNAFGSSPQKDINQIAFRMYLCVIIIELLNQDAERLKNEEV